MARAGGEKAAEYVREKQLVADLNAERERTRALQDRVIDMERHTAQTTAELDAAKRENTLVRISSSGSRRVQRQTICASIETTSPTPPPADGPDAWLIHPCATLMPSTSFRKASLVFRYQTHPRRFAAYVGHSKPDSADARQSRRSFQ